MFVVVRLSLLNLNLILNYVRFDKYKQFKLDLEKTSFPQNKPQPTMLLLEFKKDLYFAY